MKRLIVTIIVAVMTISLTGCTFVREYHRGHPHHEVIVTTPPRHIYVTHHHWRHPNYHFGRRYHPWFRHRPH